MSRQAIAQAWRDAGTLTVNGQPMVRWQFYGLVFVWLFGHG